MWYEVLPPAMIMVVALSLPGTFLHYGQKYFLGTPYKRSMHTNQDFFFYWRDEAMTGNAYKTKGLESIPDE